MTRVRVPHSRPFLGRKERRALNRVITSGHIAQGPEVEAFEHEMTTFLERRYAAAVSSGTAALHLALTAMGVGPGDRVALPTYVCSALLHAVLMTGGRPLLVDVDPYTMNIDPDDLRRRLVARTKAVIVPHMFGLPAPIQEIRRAGLPIIEDCATTLGTLYQDRPVGSWGSVTIVSFYATKMLATGEGGMVLADNGSFIRSVRESRSYEGRSSNRTRYNYKMTDLQAALGRVQLARLPGFIRRRRSLAQRYTRALAEGPWDLPPADPQHVFHRFVIRPHRAIRRFLEAVEESGVDARRPVARPLHDHLAMKGFPGADEAFRRAVSIPLYPALERKEVDHVIKSVARAGEALRE